MYNLDLVSWKNYKNKMNGLFFANKLTTVVAE